MNIVVASLILFCIFVVAVNSQGAYGGGMHNHGYGSQGLHGGYGDPMEELGPQQYGGYGNPEMQNIPAGPYGAPRLPPLGPMQGSGYGPQGAVYGNPEQQPYGQVPNFDAQSNNYGGQNGLNKPPQPFVGLQAFDGFKESNDESHSKQDNTESHTTHPE